MATVAAGPLLSEILNSVPKELLSVSRGKSFFKLGLSAFFCAAGIFWLAKAPWYALPLGWIFLGAVFSGVNALAHDCGTGGFSKNRVVDWIVGHIVSIPLLIPFENYRFQTKAHNYEQMLEKIVSGPLWYFSSIAQWFRSNFALKSCFRPGYRLKLIGSMSILYAGTTLIMALIVYFGGFWTLCKFWLLPWLAYHAWMSCFITSAYHCKQIGNKKQRTIVVYCRYPRWVELLANDMNHVLASEYVLQMRDQVKGIVPNYNLRASYNSMKQQWNEWCEEITFGPALKKSAMEAILAFGQVNWPTAIFLMVTFAASVYAALYIPARSSTLLVGFISYYLGGLGITMGYHRLWAHRSYDAAWPLKVVLLIIGSSAFEGSVLWWSRDHRAHHRWSDTPKDPYGVDKGLFLAHMGWLLVKQDDENIGKCDMTDLRAQPMLVWQHKNYWWFAALLGWGVPTMICGLGWGDWMGGFFYAAMMRTTVLMHATFCINSLAHWYGDATFSDQRSPRDSYLVSLITFGEGFHNFHHEFPYDYRNGVKLLAYDPGKWLIWAAQKFGLAYNLKRFPVNEIRKGELQMQEKRLTENKGSLSWAKEPESLPEMTWQQVKARVAEGSSLIVINGLVHDVADFKSTHPGGEKLIQSRLGTDASSAFNGGVYMHAYAANNLLSMMRVGRLVDAKKDD